MEILTAAVTLLLIMDPLGNIPVFMSVLKHLDPQRRHRVLIRELLISLAVLLVFLFVGQYLLHVLNLQQESISIAGGIVLFLIALRMIFPQEGGIMGDLPEGEPFIVPLAVPLLAGPSTMATLLLLVRSEPGRLVDWLIALTVAWAITAAILLASTFIYRLLRQRGLIAMERLTGMLLVAVAVQMLLSGVAGYMRR
ncbi:MAG: YhgN family NAAT transporter [Candidatus Entotheonellia bacterium]